MGCGFYAVRKGNHQARAIVRLKARPIHSSLSVYAPRAWPMTAAGTVTKPKVPGKGGVGTVY